MENRTFFGGIDTDTAPHLIENGAVLNSVNIRTVVSKSQNSTDAQFIDGNVYVSEVQNELGAGSNYLVGKCAQPNRAYLFIANSIDCKIISYNLDTNDVTIIISDADVTGGLGWTENTRIDCRATPDYLFWTDGGEPKYVSFNFDYTNEVHDPSILTLITRPPVIPLTIARDSDSTVSNNIQFVPLQFAYRFTNVDGFTSVLSPYSETAIPVRESEISSDPNTGNVVDITVSLSQKIPANWKFVELIVRYVEGDTFFTIKQYSKDVAADVTAVTNHNSGSAALSYTWEGKTLFAIDSTTASKQYDNVPITSEKLELAGNRLLLANNTEGYDSPLVVPGFTTGTNTFTVSEPTRATVQSYIIFVKTVAQEWYIAVIVRDGGKNYLLPKDFSIGHVSASQNITNLAGPTMFRLDDEIWAVPQVIGRSQLIELQEQGDPGAAGPPATAVIESVRYNIVSEANGVDFLDVVATDREMQTYKEFDIIEDAYEFGSGSESRAFAPHTTYDFGVQFYDGDLRKSGVLPMTSVNIPKYGPYTRQLTEEIEITLNNSVAAVPSWAKRYSVVMSKQQSSQRLIEYVADTIKVALRDREGNIILSGVQVFTTPPVGYAIYGIAVPLLPLTRYNYGYEYTEGDYIELVGVDSTGSADSVYIKGYVKTVSNGYAIISADTGVSADIENVIPESSKYIFCAGNAGALASPPYSVAWAQYQCDLVLSPDDQTTTPPYPPVAGNIASMRQFTVVTTIYNSTPADDKLYEVAKFGAITSPGASATFGNFYSSGSLTATFKGDCYTQKRIGDAGSLTCVSVTPYELFNQFPINDCGRVCLADRIGQNYLPTAIRWSNTNIPGATNSGYSTFDALDYKIIEETAGEITYLALTTKGIQEGGQLLILCSNGSFVTLVGKQQIYGADQAGAITVTSAQVLADINPLRGNWTCESPRAVCVYQGKVFWPDVKNREIIEFGDGGANPVSRFKAARLWDKIFSEITDPDDLTAGINPYCDEYLISVPELSGTKANLITSNISDPFDAYYSAARTWIYNWSKNRWVGSWLSGSEFINVNDRVFSWKGGSTPFWEEFVGEPGVYYNGNHVGIISLAFNENYPMVKTPLTISVSCDRPPDACWIKTDAQKFGVQIAQTGEWSEFEGDMMAEILRNRLSNNATAATWNKEGINGESLKGKTVLVAFLWNAENGEFFASSAGLNYIKSSGH